MISISDLKLLDAERFGERARTALALFEQRGAPIPSQGWLAKRASQVSGESISQPTVGKWLAGRAVPDTARRAWAFATALGVDAGWLVFDRLTSAAPPQGIVVEGRAPTEELAPVVRAVAHHRKSGEPRPTRKKHAG